MKTEKQPTLLVYSVNMKIRSFSLENKENIRSLSDREKKPAHLLLTLSETRFSVYPVKEERSHS